MVGWSKERVDLLTKLWNQGLTAGQIESRMGGTTRSAILGKIHRLGLTGRAKTSRFKAGYSKKPRKKRAPKQLRFGAPRAPWLNELLPPDLQSFDLADELVIPESDRRSVITLGDKECRWGIGDPTDADFHFCGKKQAVGSSYCPFHHAKTYRQVMPERRKSYRDVEKAG